MFRKKGDIKKGKEIRKNGKGLKNVCGPPSVFRGLISTA